MIYLSVLACILGGLVFALSERYKELGRLAFGIGLFVFLNNADKIVGFIGIR